jgi:hypothetical protein
MSTQRIREKLKQNSTWRGIIALVGAVAIVIRPNDIAVIIPAILTLIGSVNVIRDQ